jgi:hypothetical protein
MSATPAFTGTPDDWWENAERISHAEAEERNLGDWYIVKMNTAGQTKPNYRLSTPSKPPNMDKRSKPRYNNGESDRVRCLIRGSEPMPAWMTSPFVMAERPDGGAERVPWVRKNSGRWQLLQDGRVNINDHAMAELNPKPAFIAEDLI